MSRIQIKAGSFTFVAELQSALAPKTCAAFLQILPFRQKLIQARWSGEAAWIPLGSFDLAVGLENQKSNPEPGELLFYPQGVSETEILFPYGLSTFACKAGRLSGNSFLKIVTGQEQLPALGEQVLWNGAQDIEFTQVLNSNR